MDQMVTSIAWFMAGELSNIYDSTMLSYQAKQTYGICILHIVQIQVIFYMLANNYLALVSFANMISFQMSQTGF